MTDTLQLQRRLRRAIPAGVIVLGLLFISVVMIQQVAAQNGSGLKPPFKLITPDREVAPLSGVPPLPLNAQIVMSETFDSGFILRSNFNVNDNTRPWHLVNASGVVDSSHTWGRVAGVPLTDTLWNAATTWPGGGIITPGQPYTRNMQAYAIYGPIDMLDYTSAFISVTYAMDTLEGDRFGVAFSTNGTDFLLPASLSGRDPTLSNRQTSYFLFPSHMQRQKQVWIALVFTSLNHDQIPALGVFVEEIVMRALPAYKVYLPVTRLDATPTPTHTPTPTATPQASYLYNYTFGSGLNTDPQFLTWGGRVDNADCFTTDAGGCKWGQDIVTTGNPGGAMTFEQTGLDAIAGASPNNTAPGNFELSADFYVIQGKADARLGLIFGASLSAFGRENDVPFFDPNRNLYKFDLQFDENDNTVLKYHRLQECGNLNINDCTLLSDKTQLPGGLVGSTGTWNTITIQRQGSSIKVYVNGTLLVNVSDSTFVGDKKYGLFLQTKRLNSASNPLKIRFDNVRVRSLP